MQKVDMNWNFGGEESKGPGVIKSVLLVLFGLLLFGELFDIDVINNILGKEITIPHPQTTANFFTSGPLSNLLPQVSSETVPLFLIVLIVIMLQAYLAHLLKKVFKDNPKGASVTAFGIAGATLYIFPFIELLTGLFFFFGQAFAVMVIFGIIVLVMVAGAFIGKHGVAGVQKSWNVMASAKEGFSKLRDRNKDYGEKLDHIDELIKVNIDRKAKAKPTKSLVSEFDDAFDIFKKQKKEQINKFDDLKSDITNFEVQVDRLLVDLKKEDENAGSHGEDVKIRKYIQDLELIKRKYDEEIHVQVEPIEKLTRAIETRDPGGSHVSAHTFSSDTNQADTQSLQLLRGSYHDLDELLQKFYAHFSHFQNMYAGFGQLMKDIDALLNAVVVDKKLLKLERHGGVFPFGSSPTKITGNDYFRIFEGDTLILDGKFKSKKFEVKLPDESSTRKFDPTHTSDSNRSHVETKTKIVFALDGNKGSLTSSKHYTIAYYE